MKAVIVYSDRAFTATFKELTAGKSYLFGKGQRADFGVSGEDVAPIHFQIEFDGRKVLLKNLATSRAPVNLNGRPVVEAELNDGDVVSVGLTEVGLRMTGAPEAESIAQAPPASPTIHYESKALSSGLVLWSDPRKETSLEATLPRLLEQLTPLVMANFQGANLSAPTWLNPSDNLLGEASLDSHSLYLIEAEQLPAELGEASPGGEISTTPIDALLRLFSELHPKGAACLLLTTNTKEQVLDSIRFHRGFFCNPSGLELFLRQGARELVGALLGAIDAIVIAKQGDADWALFAKPGAEPVATMLSDSLE